MNFWAETSFLQTTVALGNGARRLLTFRHNDPDNYAAPFSCDCPDDPLVGFYGDITKLGPPVGPAVLQDLSIAISGITVCAPYSGVLDGNATLPVSYFYLGYPAYVNTITFTDQWGITHNCPVGVEAFPSSPGGGNETYIKIAICGDWDGGFIPPSMNYDKIFFSANLAATPAFPRQFKTFTNENTACSVDPATGKGVCGTGGVVTVMPVAPSRTPAAQSCYAYDLEV